ncbi:class I glutamine amidotransferase-like protein [Bisporella sp. PMI_857]|nr:class I glutamine amidotransferase-like protein [Bisporella sp. PMI_857]
MVSLKRFMPLSFGLEALLSCASAQNQTIPISPARLNIGFVLFPGFELLDVTGPLDALNLLSFNHTLNLSLIASTLEPLNNKVRMPTSANSSFGVSIVPTHTFATAPELDVLMIPGGAGTRAPVSELQEIFDFVRVRYPTLKYLITVCTGAGIAARAGVLDGRYATTNKRAWAQTTALGPNVNWVAVARWVEDGNIITTSGVSAGIDGTFGWIRKVYGEEVAEVVSQWMEYTRATDWRDDPFAGLYGLTDANNTHPGVY